MGEKKEPSEIQPANSGGKEDAPKLSKSPTGKGAGADQFIREKQFPDAAAIFTFKPAKLRDIIATAVFAFDTNSLLLPYKTDRLAFEEFKKILAELSRQKRLVLPERVAREFAVHRLGKIAELYSSAFNWKKPLQRIEAKFSPALELLSEHEDYQKARSEADKSVSKCREQLDKVLEKLTEWYESDPVLEFYKTVFQADALSACKMDEKALIDDNDLRNANFVPPGCAPEDANKMDKGIGDKVIWHTLLEVAKARSCHLVFVTQDVTKKDWVYFHKESDRVLFPRYELVEEFRRASNGKSLHIIEVSTLLELFSAEKAAVQSVQTVEQSERLPDVSSDPDLDTLRRILPLIRRSAHSFQHLRNIGVHLEDRDFVRLSRKYPNMLRRCRVQQPNNTWLPGFHSVPNPPPL